MMKNRERATWGTLVPRKFRQRRASRRRSLCAGAALGLLMMCALAMTATSAETPGFYIILHKENPRNTLDREFIADALLKNVTRWPGGDAIYPVDLKFDSPTRAAFSKAVLGRSVAAIRSYWQQRIFSGRGVPPPEVESEPAAVRYVQEHRGALGYVSTTTDVSGVKVLLIR